MPLNIQRCPNCNTRVVPMADGTCPSCRQRPFEIPYTDTSSASARRKVDSQTGDYCTASLEEESQGRSEVEVVQCTNHPGVEAIDRCTGCSEPFCANCLVEIQGQKLCGSCKVMTIQGRPAPPMPGQRPNVVVWYLVYCVLMMLMYLSVAVLGIVVLIFPEEMFESDPDMSAVGARMMGVMMLVFCLPFTLFYLVAARMPRNKAGWIVGIVAIAMGLTSACLWPMTIPLMFFWLKDATRAYYNMK